MATEQTYTNNQATRVQSATAATILNSPAAGQYLTTGNFRLSNYGAGDVIVVIEQLASDVLWGAPLLSLPAMQSGIPGSKVYSVNMNVQPGQTFRLTAIAQDGAAIDVRCMVDFSTYRVV